MAINRNPTGRTGKIGKAGLGGAMTGAQNKFNAGAGKPAGRAAGASGVARAIGNKGKPGTALKSGVMPGRTTIGGAARKPGGAGGMMNAARSKLNTAAAKYNAKKAPARKPASVGAGRRTTTPKMSRY